MPRIENIPPHSPSRRLFKKKNYRPWNLLDDLDAEKHQDIIKPNTNWAQTGHKADTKCTQTKHKPNTIKLQIKHKLNTEPNTGSDTNRAQTEHKPDTKNHFSTLVGLQRKTILFLYENCKATRSKITEPLTLEHLANQLNMRIGSIKTTLRRLQVKSFIRRLDFKNGRSGWSKYEVPNNLFSELMQLETGHKSNTNWIQTGHKPNTEPDTKPDTVSLSSSGLNYIKTTTTSGDTNLTEASGEWQNIDIEPLSKIGFTTTHISQIASQNKLSPKIVQDSIYAFSFDLQENNKAKSINGDPINFFMGILRNGNPYTPSSNYESPQDKAMRLYLERMSEVEKKRAGIEKEAISLAFNDWFKQLTDDQKRELLPENLRRNAKLEKNKILESAAKGHFEMEIWPNKKSEIIGNIE